MPLEEVWQSGDLGAWASGVVDENPAIHYPYPEAWQCRDPKEGSWATCMGDEGITSSCVPKMSYVGWGGELLFGNSLRSGLCMLPSSLAGRQLMAENHSCWMGVTASPTAWECVSLTAEVNQGPHS